MEPIEYVILAAAAALVVFTLIYNIIKRKRRKGKPCSGCADCSTCAKYGCGCYGATPKDKESDNKN